MAKELSSLVVSLQGNIAGFAKSMQAATAPVTSFVSSVASIAAGTAIGFGAAIAGMKLLDKVADGMTLGVSMAADMEQAQVAMQTMLGSATAAKKVLADLTTFAAQTPFQLPELVTATKSLLAFGVSADQVMPALKAIGDISAGIGAPIAEIAELYGKAKVQGRLFAQDINQLTGRGIPIIQELAKQFGVTDDAVKGLVESGQINFAHLEKAFISLSSAEGKFAGLMEAQSHTLSGLWSTFKDTIGLTLMGVAQTFIEAFNIKDAVATLTGWLSIAGEKITAWVAYAAQVIKNLWAVIQPVLAAIWEYIAGVWQSIYNAVAPIVTKIYQVIVDRWEEIVRSVVAFVMSIYNVVSAIWGAIWELITTVAKMIWDTVVSIFGWGAQETGTAVASTGDTVTDTFNNIVSVTNWLRDMVTTAINTVAYCIKNWSDVLDITVLTIWYQITKLGNQFTYVFTEVIPAVVAWAAKAVWNTLHNMVGWIGVGMTNLIANITNIMTSIPELISGKTTFEKLWTPLTEGFQEAIVEGLKIPDRQVGELEQNLSDALAAKHDEFGTGLAKYLADKKKEADSAADAVIGFGKKVAGAFKVPPVEVKPEVDQKALTQTQEQIKAATSTKEADAVRVGSAQAQLLAYSRPKGVGDYQKNQLDEQKKGNAIATKIEANTRKQQNITVVTMPT